MKDRFRIGERLALAEGSDPAAPRPAAATTLLPRVAAFAMAGSLALAAAMPPPPRLVIERSDLQVRLSWPATQGVFRLQTSHEVSASAPWQDLAPAAVVDGRHELLLSVEGDARFFRLQQSGGSAPSLGAWSLSQPTVAVDTHGVLRFDYSDADGDLAAFRLTWTNVLGHFESRLDAEPLGVRNSQGTVEIPIPAFDFPLGITRFALRSVDRTGLESTPISFEIQFVGSGKGSPPSLRIVSSSAESLARPSAEAPESVASWRVTVRVTDADRDLSRLRIRWLEPSGRVTTSESPTSPPSGEESVFERTLLGVDRETPTGEYELTLWAIDAAGNTSEPATTKVRVDDASPARPPTLTEVAPRQAYPGGILRVTGTGFDSVPARNVVLLADVALRVLSGDGSHLEVELPAEATTGDLEVITPIGSAVLPAPVQVLESLNILATRRLHAGESAPLGAAFGANADHPAADLEWSVLERSEVAGQVGHVDTNHVYHAPSALAAPVDVTLVAHATSPGGVRTSAFASLHIEPVEQGSERTIDPNLGAVVSADSRDARLVVPPGALALPTAIRLERVAPTNAPSPVAEESTLGAVRCEPDGLSFAEPVRLTVPLSHWRQPGSALRVSSRREASTPVEELAPALVDESGFVASVWITHFSTVAVHGRFDNLNVPGPVALTRLEPGLLLEGSSQPVLLEGRDFDAGMNVELAAPDGTAISSTLVRIGQVLYNPTAPTRLGILVESLPDPSLRDGESRSLNIRVTRRDGSTASLPFAIRGLDEAILPAGTTTVPSAAFPASKEWSRIEIPSAAIVRTTGRALLWQATHDIVVAGTLDGTGAAGANANGGQGGTEGATGGAGGAAQLPGGNGRPGAVRYPDPSFREGRDPFPYAVQAYPSFGLGGRAGSPVGAWNPLDPACYGSYEDFSACYRRLVGLLPRLPRLEQREAYWLDLRDRTLDFVNRYASGWRGEIGHPGADQPSGDPEEARISFPGGGGGGGGTGMAGLVPIGGGAGGEGGAAIRLAGRRIRLGAGSVLSTRGGAGGHGWATSLGSGLASASGGGGGGGAAGTLHLLARSAVEIEAPDRFAPDVNAGTWGQGGASFERRAFVSSPGNILGDGIFPLEANYLYGLSLIGKSKFFVGGPELMEVDSNGASTPFESQVRTRQCLDLRHEPATLGSPLPLERLTLVNARGTRTVPVSRVVRGGNAIGHWPLVLAPGINTLTLGGTGTIDSALRRVVLVVTGPDTDGDTLSDAEEALLGFNAQSADTDGDGIPDADEAIACAGMGSTGGPAPSSGGSSTDRDGDGWPDAFEIAFHTNPTSNTSFPRSHAQEPGELALCTTVAQPPARATQAGESGFQGFVWNTVIARPPVQVTLR